MGPFALALVAGVISFSSPCCLPLMPGYVSYVSGVTAGGAGAVSIRQRRALGAAALFVAGFTAVFTALGVAATVLGGFLVSHRSEFTRVSGLFVVAMGLVTMGVVRLPFLYRERRLDLRRIAPGPVGALPLGMAFAVGWTPCIGPVLAAILTAAASTADPGRGAALLFTYSLGLGIPFLLLALGIGGAGRLSYWLRRHGRMVELTGGAVLVLMGVLMITGVWLQLFTPILRLFSKAGWPPV